MLLALSEFWETIIRYIELGGNVLWAIMAVLLLMWTFILERYWYFYMVHPGRVQDVVSAWNSRADTTSWYAKRIREQLISQVSSDLKQYLVLIKTLIAICPLLGLLGTVTGMIQVFDVLQIVGTGNPRAMADGVSKATVPTMSGMVAALSGIYFSSQLEQTANVETEKLEDLLQHH